MATLQNRDVLPSGSEAHLLDQMRQASVKASGLLKAMSHPDRLLLLCHISQGEFCVRELEQRVGISQPSLSQQLGVLRHEGLVLTRRDGKQVYYSVANDDVLAILNLLYERFCQCEGAQS